MQPLPNSDKRENGKLLKNFTSFNKKKWIIFGVALSFLFCITLTTRIYPREIMNTTRFTVIFEAGSTHTSVNIYQWEYPFKNFHEYAPSMETSPGISSFANNPSAIEQNLRPLADYANSVLPEKLSQPAYAYLKASAGVRLLKDEQRQAVLSSARNFLLGYRRDRFYSKPEWTKVISGKDEGTFGWISLNYLLGTFNHSLSTRNQQSHKKLRNNICPSYPPSYSVIDLGGGSMQTVFELPKKTPVLLRLKDVVELHLFGRTFRLFSRSWNEYGREVMLEKLLKELTISELNQPVDLKSEVLTFKSERSTPSEMEFASSTLPQSSVGTDVQLISFPCAPLGVTYISYLSSSQLDKASAISTDISTSYKKAQVARLVGKGNYSQCQQMMREFNIFSFKEGCIGEGKKRKLNVSKVLEDSEKARQHSETAASTSASKGTETTKNGQLAELDHSSHHSSFTPFITHPYDSLYTSSAAPSNKDSSPSSPSASASSSSSFSPLSHCSLNGALLPTFPSETPIIGISNFGYVFNTLLQVHRKQSSSNLSLKSSILSKLETPNETSSSVLNERSRMQPPDTPLERSASSLESFTKSAMGYCSLSADQLARYLPEQRGHREGYCFSAALIGTLLVDGINVGSSHWTSTDESEFSPLISPVESDERVNATTYLNGTEVHQPYPSSQSSHQHQDVFVQSPQSHSSVHMMTSLYHQNDANWPLGAAIYEAHLLSKGDIFGQHGSSDEEAGYSGSDVEEGSLNDSGETDRAGEEDTELYEGEAGEEADDEDEYEEEFEDEERMNGWRHAHHHGTMAQFQMHHATRRGDFEFYHSRHHGNSAQSNANGFINHTPFPFISLFVSALVVFFLASLAGSCVVQWFFERDNIQRKLAGVERKKRDSPSDDDLECGASS